LVGKFENAIMNDMGKKRRIRNCTHFMHLPEENGFCIIAILLLPPTYRSAAKELRKEVHTPRIRSLCAASTLHCSLNSE
jgi:hypothetical protein